MSGPPLLLDENLAEALLPRIQALYPGSVHVRRVLGSGVSDRRIWEHAARQALVLVTRDQDFERLSTLLGAPPKGIWLAAHNLGNAEVVALLESARERNQRFVAEDDSALLVLTK